MRSLVLFVALLAAPALAQDAERLPVWGGAVGELHALGGDRVLAVRSTWATWETRALFRSDDAGRTWQRAAPPAAAPFGPLAVGEDGTVYLGTARGQGAGILRSTDGGASWEAVAVPDGLDLRGLAAGAPGRIVAIGGEATGGGAQRMWVTDDGGATWDERTLPYGYEWPVALGRDLFAVEFGYGGGRLFRWADGADGWRYVDLGTSRPDVVYRTRGGTLFVAKGAYPGPTGYYMARSDDGGDTWTDAGWGRLDDYPWSISCENATCYATFFGDPYFGAGWVRSFGAADGHRLGPLPRAADPTTAVPVGGRLLVGDRGGRGVYASDDGGQTWAPSNEGIDAPALVALAHDGTWALADGFRGPNRLLRVADDGRWLDASPTWGEYDQPPLFNDLETFQGEAYLAEFKHVLSTADGSEFRPWSIDAEHGLVPRRLIRLPGRLLAAGEDALLATADGVDWAPIPFDLPIGARQRDDVADAVEVDGALVVSVQASGGRPENGRGIWRSEDDGQTWARALADPLSVDALVVLADGAVVAASPDGLLRSADGGRSFAAVEGSPAGVLALVASGVAGYAATPDALFRSLDGGATWEPFVDLGETVRALASDAPGRLLVGTDDGLFRVADRSVSVVAGPARAEGLAVTVGPNPTAGAATVRVTVPEAGAVSGAVFDALGRRVAVLAERATSGDVSWRVETAGLAPGVYLVRVRAGAEVGVARLTVR